MNTPVTATKAALCGRAPGQKDVPLRALRDSSPRWLGRESQQTFSQQGRAGQLNKRRPSNSMTLHRRDLRPSAYNPPIHPMTEDDWHYWQKRNGKAPRVSWIKRVLGGRRP